jgi:hypothetical protein
MSFHKHSIVGGRGPDGKYDNTSRCGHISTATALEIARRRGWLKAELVHVVSDMSGHGRGGETRFAIDAASGAVTKLGYVDVDDSADVAELDDVV